MDWRSKREVRKALKERFPGISRHLRTAVVQMHEDTTNWLELTSLREKQYKAVIADIDQARQCLIFLVARDILADRYIPTLTAIAPVSGACPPGGIVRKFWIRPLARKRA